MRPEEQPENLVKKEHMEKMNCEKFTFSNRPIYDVQGEERDRGDAKECSA